MIRSGLLGVVLLTASCGWLPDITINNNNNNTNNAGGVGPTVLPSAPPGAAVDSIHLGCFGMVDGSGLVLPSCAANLAEYVAPAGSEGTLDATPLDAAGNKIPGLTVSSWTIAGTSCKLNGETSGADGFNPGIEIGLGSCDVSVLIAGKVGGPRRFTGQ